MNQLEEKINQLTEACYMQKEQEACTCMQELIPMLLQLVDQAPDSASTSANELPKNVLVNIISHSMKAMEEKDYVLLADILKYELLGAGI